MSHLPILGDGATSCYMCGGSSHNFLVCPRYLALSSEKQVPPIVHKAGALI